MLKSIPHCCSLTLKLAQVYDIPDEDSEALSGSFSSSRWGMLGTQENETENETENDDGEKDGEDEPPRPRPPPRPPTPVSSLARPRRLRQTWQTRNPVAAVAAGRRDDRIRAEIVTGGGPSEGFLIPSSLDGPSLCSTVADQTRLQERVEEVGGR